MKPKKTYQKGTLRRLFRMLVSYYPVALPLVIFCIIVSAAVSAMPAIFTQNIIAVLEQNAGAGWDVIGPQIIRLTSLLAAMYLVSLVLSFAYTRAMAVLSQGALKKMREQLFDHMQDLPIKYFDTHAHGDIMSHYTNDIDTLRQLISQSLPQLLVSGVMVITLFSIMLYYSVWMALVVLFGVSFMLVVVKKIGGNSAKYFMRQQKAIGQTEGYVEEMMAGQKVIKVFCHENEAKAGFDEVNDALFQDSEKANTFANILAPIIMNIGNLIYVMVAMAGGAFLLSKAPNVSISGLAFSISIVVPFLNMTRQFSGNINQVSQQLNAVIMGLAGASRMFALLDEQKESDEGTVTLVNAQEMDGVLTESAERTGIWAWRQPLPDGTLRYTRLSGDVRLQGVDFGYEQDKTVLHDVSLFAEPGQKVAFVGARTCATVSTTLRTARFATTASTSTKSASRIYGAPSAWFCRTPTSLRARCWKTFAMAGWMRRMTSVSPRQNLRARTTLSRACRKDMIRL